MNIVIVGGTGDLGFGLGYRWAKAGHQIVIGSRQKERAMEAAGRINEMTGTQNAKGLANEDAVLEGDIVVLAVPDAARAAVLELIKPLVQGKTVVDVTIPLRFNPLRYEAPEEGSNAQQTQAVLGEGVKVVAAFHTVSAAMLENPEKEVKGDALIMGGDEEAKNTLIGLADDIGLRGFDAGSLLNARTVEGLTPMIIGMNKRYKRGHIGIALTGI